MTATLTAHDLGNNEGIVTGTQLVNGMWLALTRTETRWFKTEAGAVRWLARRGYRADGTRDA